MDEKFYEILMEEIISIKERLSAVEKEQRKITEDILSGQARERIHKRILGSPDKQIKKDRKDLDDQIKIEI